LKIEVSEACKDPHGFMQQISYQHNSRLRVEQFAGTLEQVSKAVRERIAELKRMKV
jgi:hypothetical protein